MDTESECLRTARPKEQCGPKQEKIALAWVGVGMPDPAPQPSKAEPDVRTHVKVIDIGE